MLAPVGVSLGFFDDARAVAQLADTTGEPGRTRAAAARASHLVDFLRIIGVMSRLADHTGAVTVGARIRHETGVPFPPQCVQTTKPRNLKSANSPKNNSRSTV